jgi:hypothetical protein
MDIPHNAEVDDEVCDYSIQNTHQNLYLTLLVEEIHFIKGSCHSLFNRNPHRMSLLPRQIS